MFAPAEMPGIFRGQVQNMGHVTLKALIDKMQLRELTTGIDTSKINIPLPDINRPALQLTGFFEHFETVRVQIIGYVEQAYISRQGEEERRLMIERLLKYRIPCLIFA